MMPSAPHIQPPTPPNAPALQDMVRLFNESTAKLEEAYAALQAEVHALNDELEQTNTELTSRIAEITEIKEYLDRVLNGVTNGVVAVDTRGVITAFNRGAERITGHASADAIGRQFEGVLGVPFGIDFDAINAGAPGDEAHYVTGELIDVHGRWVPVRESTSLMHDVAGAPIGAVKVFEDLSEIRELEAGARQRDRLSALGEMAATVAHEIRNPLGGIEGFAALLARDVEESDPRRRLVDQILLGTRSLNKVVTELLLFTRPIQYSMQFIDMRSLLDSTWDFVAQEAETRNIRLERAYPERGVQVRADSEQLRRAFLNLMVNAVQAMADGGTLRIGIAERTLTDEDLGPLEEQLQQDWIEVTVQDDGPGIAPDALDKIFNPFFTTKEKGTGLGLAIALKIVEGHSGWIHAASDASGTTFATYLPLTRHRQDN